MVSAPHRQRPARPGGLVVFVVLALLAGCIGPATNTTASEEPGRFPESDPDVIYQVHVESECDPGRALALPSTAVSASRYSTLEVHYALETAAGRLQLTIQDGNGIRIFERAASAGQPQDGDETVKASAGQGDWTVSVTCGPDADDAVEVGVTVKALG